MKTYETCLFDLDGTLTDTTQTWLGIFRDGLTDFGITGLPDAQIAKHTHDWREMVKLGVPYEELQDFIARAHERASERLPEAPLFEGVLSMLNRLRNRGVRTGIFTTMDRPILEPVMWRHSELEDLMDVVVAGTDVEQRKPHPAGVYKALGMMAIYRRGSPIEHSMYFHPSIPSSSVYIGDKDTDILTANNAGIDGVLFYPPQHHGLYDSDALASMNPADIITHWDEMS